MNFNKSLIDIKTAYEKFIFDIQYIKLYFCKTNKYTTFSIFRTVFFRVYH